jgi:hypothetical protein
MDREEMAERLAAAEREIALLRTVAARAHGEAMYAGLIAPAVWTVIIQQGLLAPAVARDVLDRALLRHEEAEGSFPGSKEALAYARERLEHLMSLVPPIPE